MGFSNPLIAKPGQHATEVTGVETEVTQSFDSNKTDFKEPTPLMVALPLVPPTAKKSNHYVQLINLLTSYWLSWGEAYGYQVKFKALTGSAALLALDNGEIQVDATGFYSPSYAEKYYFSIPYIEFPTALYRRAGDKPAKLRLAIHKPSEIKVNLLNQASMEVSENSDLKELMNQEHDLLYSWAPNTAERILSELNLDTQYQRIQDGVPPLRMRAMVSADNRQLMLEINEGLRKVDAHKAQALWQQHSSSDNQTFRLMLGQYVSQLTPSQQQYVIDHPVLDHGFIEDGLPPYMMRRELDVVGFSAELVNELSQRIGIEFQPVSFPSFKASVQALQQQQIDLFPLIFKTPERAQKLNFTVPIDKSLNVIVSKVENDFVSLKEISRSRIAVVKGHHISELLAAELPDTRLIYFNDISQALIALAEDRVDAYVGNSLVSSYLQHKLNLTELRINKARDFDSKLMFRMAVPKENIKLGQLLNLGLNSIDNVQMEELHQKWVNMALTHKEGLRISQLNLRVIIGGSSIFAMALLWGLYQRKQLRLRREAQDKVEKALTLAQKSRLEAEQSTRAKSEFLARMSHEIRTPMNGVMGMAEALSFTRLNPEQKDLLDTLNGSARNLMALLNDVLDFSKMESDKLTVESIPMNLVAILQGVIDTFRHKASSSGLRLSMQVDPQLQASYFGDPTRLMQTLNNLVSNAMKFTESGFVELSIQVLDSIHQPPQTGKEGDETTDAVYIAEVNDDQVLYHQLRIDVRDSGIGISADKIDSLFSPFVQAEGDISRRFGGTGLGLSICKEIVEAMGGAISVNSMPGNGSLFSITLELAVCEEPQMVAATCLASPRTSGMSLTLPDDVSDVPDLSGLKILLAEDNAVNRKVVCGQLSRLGLHVDSAENGLIAYQMHQDGDYDIILSDCHMPEMDGFTLATTIVNERSGARPRLIALTADALSGAAQHCYQAGFDDYISKPCPVETLRKKLQASANQLTHLPRPSIVGEEEMFSVRSENLVYPDLGLSENLAVNLAANNEHTVVPEEHEGFPPVGKSTNPEGEVSDAYHLNREHVLELSGEDPQMALEVLQVYLENNGSDRSQLTLACTEFSGVNVKDIAHRIKGGVLYMGAEDLGNQAQHIEDMALNGQDLEVTHLVTRLETGLAELEIEVALWCEELEQRVEECSR